MALDYNPKDAVQIWEKGDYEAVLKNVETTISKKKPDGSGGNPMEVWTWEAYHHDGRTRLITDYVVIPGATFKIKQLADALGKKSEFEAGTFQAEDNLNCNVMLSLVVDVQAGFDDKNKVAKVNAVPSLSGASAPATQRQMASAGAGGGRPSRPPTDPPFGNEQVFEGDDSIPFAHRLPARWI